MSDYETIDVTIIEGNGRLIRANNDLLQKAIELGRGPEFFRRYAKVEKMIRSAVYELNRMNEKLK